MFVLDLYCPSPIDDDEGDYGEDEEEGTRVDEDAGMDVDEGDDEGDEGYEADEGRNGGAPADDILEANLVQLAVWADVFLGDHLRMLEPTQCHWTDLPCHSCLPLPKCPLSYGLGTDMSEAEAEVSGVQC